LIKSQDINRILLLKKYVFPITGLNLMLDPSFFIQQTERLSGTIVLVVSDEENVIQAPELEIPLNPQADVLYYF